jgi:hypothetical protein
MIRVTRNPEVDDLVTYIRSDPELSTLVALGFVRLWEYNLHIYELLRIGAIDLLISILAVRVAALKWSTDHHDECVALDTLLNKASLHCVADDLLQEHIADYTPMSRDGSFEVVNAPVSRPFRRAITLVVGVAMLCIAAFCVGTLVELGSISEFGRQEAVYALASIVVGLISLSIAVRLVFRDMGCVWVLLMFL